MKIAAIQMDIAWEDRTTNFRKASMLAAEAADNGADFLLFPEMFATGFSMNTAVTAEPPDGETTIFLQTLALRHSVGVGGGLVLMQSNGKPQNCALFLDRSGNRLSLYAKTYLFGLGGEAEHHTPGQGPVPFIFEGVRCAGFICYDLRFPELFRPICRNTDALFIIASWPASRSYHWDILLKARSIENQLYVAGVNRVGRDTKLEYAGGTIILSPTGEIEAHASAEEEIIYADIRPATVQAVRSSLPFLNDCRG